ncbi:hypothetical protein AVEN_188619-1 [Araneus ventricosus]|uniref:Uncharacterized protein n=1 Tax=Araneus ventricosus TaxID=182803 RepID=A0A4Y2F9T3_ARAVE|nr:hypothetical protein AVEN_175857-1 [Araneus ventricosus]GBM38165.1 hypothetical protein AVEN_114054-1 [Araneus ventricosus]GBM38263.1 hypothetical protein AVEN_188619-1 [Araneus ventricosus]
MSSILHGVGAKVPKAFKDLYNLWFDVEENKAQYLKTLEKEGINLTNVSDILHGAGANAVKAFKDLYDLWFDEQGNKKKHLKHFVKKKGFTVHNLSGILSRSGANAKDAFEKLHGVCFNDKGERTKFLDDFYNADFEPGHLSCMLCGAGVHASSILKRFHSVVLMTKEKRQNF